MICLIIFILHRVCYAGAVPQCETYDKQNGRFPLLGEYDWKEKVLPEIRSALWMFLTLPPLVVPGKQFLVTFDQCVIRHQSMDMGFPCLLCERRLSGCEFYAHVFGWEHVKHFLVSNFTSIILYNINVPSKVTLGDLSSVLLVITCGTQRQALHFFISLTTSTLPV